MRRCEAIEIVLEHITDEDAVLSTTGMISREVFDTKDRKGNFYMLGSMGLISSIGLGVALNTNRRVFVFDGDGSILMDAGILAVIGSEKACNLIHIVFDNECYQSTGGQPTVSNTVQLEKIAKDSGYTYSVKVTTKEQLKSCLKDINRVKKPTFILVKVIEKTDRKPPRVSLSPTQVRDRFMQFLKKEQSCKL